MSELKVGDIVARKSYGGDVYFRIADVINTGKKPVYVLRGLLHRLQADSFGDDLVLPDPVQVNTNIQREMDRATRQAHPTARSTSRSMPLGFFLINRVRNVPGKVLHLDGDESFMEKCLSQYRKAGIKAVGRFAAESEQPGYVKELLEKHKPDILVVTGHDAMKKNPTNPNSLDNFRNSRHFMESAKAARAYQPNPDKLCVYAGACQSYYEGIMSAGANFASSPGRILINALDPAVVAERVAVTELKKFVTPQQISELTVSGREGIWGINTKGHMAYL